MMAAQTVGRKKAQYVWDHEGNLFQIVHLRENDMMTVQSVVSKERFTRPADDFQEAKPVKGESPASTPDPMKLMTYAKFDVQQKAANLVRAINDLNRDMSRAAEAMGRGNMPQTGITTELAGRRAIAVDMASAQLQTTMNMARAIGLDDKSFTEAYAAGVKEGSR